MIKPPSCCGPTKLRSGQQTTGTQHGAESPHLDSCFREKLSPVTAQGCLRASAVRRILFDLGVDLVTTENVEKSVPKVATTV